MQVEFCKINPQILSEDDDPPQSNGEPSVAVHPFKFVGKYVQKIPGLAELQNVEFHTSTEKFSGDEGAPPHPNKLADEFDCNFPRLLGTTMLVLKTPST